MKLVIAAASLLALATAGHTAVDDFASEMTPLVATGAPRGGSACCCDTPVDCGSYCCNPGDTCNFNVFRGCCPADRPTPCAHDCCPANQSCGADGFCQATCAPGQVSCGDRCCAAGTTCNPFNGQCCPAGTPIACPTTCCPVGGTCPTSGNSCGAACPAGTVDCFNGYCCAADNTCNTLNPRNTLCCPPGSHACLDGCCAAGNTCNPVNTSICCLPGYPVPCSNTCCPEGYQCTADGNDCLTPHTCSDPNYPRDCGNGFCCPFDDKCQTVLGFPWCCIDIPEEKGCCPLVGRALIETLGGTSIKNSAKGHGGPKCRKSTKVRPFEILQVTAGSQGTPASFDTANHEYSVGFDIGNGIVLKVPIVREDTSSGSLSVMIPPFLLSSKSHGKATAFLVTDGVTSDTCVTKVRIAKLPKSASKILGLVTHSWLRANNTVYTTARPTLATAEAAPFINPEILGDVDTVIARTGSLLPSFEVSGGKAASKGELAKTAKAADALLTGILTAGQRVGDSAFAAACGTWLQALAKAKDSNDAALKAAEAAYAAALLGASGPSAQGVAKFVTACGAVTAAGVGASAASVAGGAVPSTGTDAQAAATAICGATISATSTICGVSSLVAGASAPASGRSAFGKTLLQGALQASTAARTNYGGINVGSAKVCGCRQPHVKQLVDTCITIITTCDHTRRVGPRFCLPHVPAQPASGFSTTTTTLPLCGNGITDAGEDCDTAAPASCGAGRTCEGCRCVGSGNPQITLIWGTVDDLDLHVVEPSGEEIGYGNRTSDTGGTLDVDSNAGCGSPDENPVENVFWPVGTASQGNYTVYVDFYRRCTDGTGPVHFSVRTLVNGVETFYDGEAVTPDACGPCTACGTCLPITTFAFTPP